MKNKEKKKLTALHVSIYSGTIDPAKSSNEIHFLRWFKTNFNALKLKLERSIRSWTLWYKARFRVSFA